MLIRNERPEDACHIDRIVTAAFEREAEATLVRALRESGCETISIVAEDGQTGALTGHIMFTPVALENNSNLKFPNC